MILSELKDLEFTVIPLNARRGRWTMLTFNSFLYFICLFILTDFLEDFCMHVYKDMYEYWWILLYTVNTVNFP